MPILAIVPGFLISPSDGANCANTYSVMARITKNLTLSNTKLQFWAERGRVHLALVDEKTEQITYAEAWDEDAAELLEDLEMPSDTFIFGRLTKPQQLHRAWLRQLGGDV